MSKASTTFSSWADAALAGLPPDDEAVQMAELAATAGRSLEVPSHWQRSCHDMQSPFAHVLFIESHAADVYTHPCMSCWNAT